jgi:uncharacterized membrane protein YbhN (UPF0104 family)
MAALCSCRPASGSPGSLGCPTVASPAALPVVQRSRHRLRRVVGVAFALGVVGFSAADARTVGRAAAALATVRFPWLVVALAAEAASLGSFGLERRVLLGATGRPAGRSRVVSVTLAGSALSRVLPGGTAISLVWAYRQLRARGVARAPTLWVLLMAGALSSFSLFVLVVVGAEIAGATGPVASLRGMAAMLGALPAIGASTAWLVRRSSALRKATGHLASRLEAASSLAEHLARLWRETWRKLRVVRPGPSRWLGAFALAALNWAFDGAVVVASIAALDGRVPWHGVAVAYGISQIATSLPLAPGGIGVADASLAGLLVAYGLPAPKALAAVVLYRVLTSVVTAGLGGLSWLRVRRDRYPEPPVAARPSAVRHNAAAKRRPAPANPTRPHPLLRPTVAWASPVSAVRQKKGGDIG